MRQSADLLESGKISGEKVLITPAVEFRTDGRTTAKATAYLVDGDTMNRVYLALDPDTSNSYMAEYQIVDGIVSHTTNGTWVDNAVDPEADKHVLQALKAIDAKVDSLRQSVNEELRTKKEARKHRIDRALGTGAVLAVIATVGSGVAFGWHKLISEPRQEKAAAVATFDKSGYDLPGEGVVVAEGQVGVISSKELGAIPELNDGDTLEHPRRVTISESNDCTEIEVTVDPNSRISVVAAERSVFEGSAYSIARSGKVIEFCVSRVVDGDDGSTNTSDIALQAK